MKKVLKIFPLAFLLLSLFGCGMPTDYKYTRFFELTDYLILPDAQVYEYEQYVIKETPSGGSCVAYRGVVLLTNREGQKIKNKFKWTQTDNEIDFKTLDTSNYSQVWYTCPELENYFVNSDTAVIRHLYFDGEAQLAFDFMDKEDYYN